MKKQQRIEKRMTSKKEKREIILAASRIKSSDFCRNFMQGSSRALKITLPPKPQGAF